MREVFFRPDPVGGQSWRVPAVLYNRARLLLRASPSGCVFVPIRSMQYLAIIDDEEFIFVDGLGGYRIQDGEGGRLIQLAWRDLKPQQREGLAASVACQIEFYATSGEVVMNRLIPAFSEALMAMEKGRRDQQRPLSAQGARVVSLRA